MTTRALVYGDIDLNLIDGSAIWLQSVTQALAAGRLRGDAGAQGAGPHQPPDRAAAGRARGHRAQAVRGAPARGARARSRPRRPRTCWPGWTRRQPHDLVVLRGRAVTAAAAKSGAFAGRLWPYLTDVPQSVPGLTSAAAEELGMIASAARYLLCQTEELRCFLEGSIPAACGKCVLLPPILADDPPASRGAAAGRVAAAARLLRQVRAALEHPGDDRAAGPAGRPGHRRGTAHGRRQDPRRPRRLPAADAGRARRRWRDLARRALAGGGDAARGVLRHRAGLAAPRAGREPGAVDQGTGVRRPRAAGDPQPHPDARGAARRRLPAVRGQPGRRRAAAAAAAAADPALYRRAADRTGQAAERFTLDRAAERLARVPGPGHLGPSRAPAAKRPAGPSCASWWPGTT